MASQFTSIIIRSALLCMCFSPGCFSLDSGSAATASTEKREQTVILAQNSFVAGRIDAYFTANSLRINFGSAGTYLVANAPSWRVVMYNQKRNLGMEMSYQDWLKHQTMWSFAGEEDWLSSAKIVKIADVKAFGYMCDKYNLASTLPDGRVVPKSFGTRVSYVVTRNEVATEQACKIFQRALDLPLVNALPLELVEMTPPTKMEGMSTKAGGNERLLKMVKVAVVEQKLPPGLFTYPTKFKAVKHECQVAVDDSRTKRAEQMLNAFK